MYSGDDEMTKNLRALLDFFARYPGLQRMVGGRVASFCLFDRFRYKPPLSIVPLPGRIPRVLLRRLAHIPGQRRPMAKADPRLLPRHTLPARRHQVRPTQRQLRLGATQGTRPHLTITLRLTLTVTLRLTLTLT